MRMRTISQGTPGTAFGVQGAISGSDTQELFSTYYIYCNIYIQVYTHLLPICCFCFRVAPMKACHRTGQAFLIQLTFVWVFTGDLARGLQRSLRRRLGVLAGPSMRSVDRHGPGGPSWTHTLQPFFEGVTAGSLKGPNPTCNHSDVQNHYTIDTL